MSTRFALCNKVASGQALKATLLEHLDGCGEGDVALIGYRGTIEVVSTVPVTDAVELRNRLTNTLFAD